MELKQSATPIHDEICGRWEQLYIDQGGALTTEQRDQAFTEAVAALRAMEERTASTKSEPIAWWDRFNAVLYTRSEDAERARSGGNEVIPIRDLATLDAFRDTVRLDEIESTRCYPYHNGAGWTFTVSADRSMTILRRGVGKTARDAIDAAVPV